MFFRVQTDVVIALATQAIEAVVRTNGRYIFIVESIATFFASNNHIDLTILLSI